MRSAARALLTVHDGDIGIFGDHFDIFIFFGQGEVGLDLRPVRADDDSIDTADGGSIEKIGVFP